MIHSGGRRDLLPKNAHKGVIYILLTAASAALLFPMVYMVCNSFMESREVMKAYNEIEEKKKEIEKLEAQYNRTVEEKKWPYRLKGRR